MIDVCLNCVLPICDDRSKDCAFVQIKPRVVKAEREQERIEKRQAHNRRMYEARRPEILERRKARYQADPQKDIARSRAWVDANRDRRREWDRQRKQA